MPTQREGTRREVCAGGERDNPQLPTQADKSQDRLQDAGLQHMQMDSFVDSELPRYRQIRLWVLRQDTQSGGVPDHHSVYRFAGDSLLLLQQAKKLPTTTKTQTSRASNNSSLAKLRVPLLKDMKSKITILLKLFRLTALSRTPNLFRRSCHH